MWVYIYIPMILIIGSQFLWLIYGQTPCQQLLANKVYTSIK